jgi:hypothetical protein
VRKIGVPSRPTAIRDNFIHTPYTGAPKTAENRHGLETWPPGEVQPNNISLRCRST